VCFYLSIYLSSLSLSLSHHEEYEITFAPLILYPIFILCSRRSSSSSSSLSLAALLLAKFTSNEGKVVVFFLVQF